MFKKLLTKGIEKVTGAFGFDTKQLREDLDAYCKNLVANQDYLLRFRADDGELSSWTFVNENNRPIDVPEDFTSEVKDLLDKHINRKRYRLKLTIKNGDLQTVSIQDGVKPDLDFKNDDLNQAYKSFRDAFEHLQDTVSDQMGNDEIEDIEILYSHLEEISERIEEIEAICD